MVLALLLKLPEIRPPLAKNKFVLSAKVMRLSKSCRQKVVLAGMTLTESPRVRT